jgi:thiol-disulfide isomerase/thioredoxin
MHILTIMFKHVKNLFLPGIFLVILSLSSWITIQSQPHDVKITIHLRGVYESNISLLALSPSQTYKPILEKKDVKAGDTSLIVVPAQYLPGEFVLRFDYKENMTSNPYPGEKYLFINDQDLGFWVSPMFSNNPDSSYFQDGEKENAAFARFSGENSAEKEKLALLQNFLMEYDDTKSDLYKECIREYEKRRGNYNKWLAARASEDKAYFVSTLYSFQYVPGIPWEGTANDRIHSMIDHYFDGTDFKDSLMIRTSDMNKWMDGYVNLYGQMVTTAELRDSLFSLAGKTAIEKAKLGHPLVYGWMVDYFYRGYEVNGIDAGIKILEPYLNDPNCKTTKQQEIERRLKGMETIVPGTKAPDISLNDAQGNPFELYAFTAPSQYILVLFWSADCEHCEAMLQNLYPWQQQPEINKKVTVVAVSLDETDTELAAWNQKVKKLTGWKHVNAPDGVRSKTAYDYYVLATPEMFLLDAKTMNIVAKPKSMEELEEAVK